MGVTDYFDEKDKDRVCPECEKHKKHVKLVANEGKVFECPVCHYTHMARR